MSLSRGLPVAEWLQATEKIFPEADTQILSYEGMNLSMLCPT